MMCNEKRFTLFFDSMMMPSRSQKREPEPIIIFAEYDSQDFSHWIGNHENNEEIFLGIGNSFVIDKYMIHKHINITVFNGDVIAINERVEIDKNTFGILSSNNKGSFSLTFRAVTNFSRDISIHGVNKLHYTDYQIKYMLREEIAEDTFIALDSSSNEHLIKILNLKADISDNEFLDKIAQFVVIPRHPCLIQLEGFIYDDEFSFVFKCPEGRRINEIDFPSLSDNEKSKILYGLFSCISLVHDYKFMYGRMNPLNIYVTREYEVRLADLEIYRDVTENSELVDEFFIGSLIENLGIENDWIRVFLKNKDSNMRITCSEMCTLIESGYVSWLNSDENSSLYFDKLSRLYDSKPPRDEIIWGLALFYGGIEGCFLYIDLIKLAFNIGIPNSDFYFDIVIRKYRTVAFDVEFFPTLDCSLIFGYIDNAYLSKVFDAFDYEYRFYLKCLVIQSMKRNKKLIKEMVFKKWAGTKGNLLNYKTFILVYCELELYLVKNKKVQAMMLRFLLQYFVCLPTKRKSWIGFCEFLIKLGFTDVSSILAGLYLQDRCYEKAKYYAELAFKNGEKKSAAQLGFIAYYNNYKEYSRYYFSISAEFCPFSKYMMALYYFSDGNDDYKGYEFLKDSVNAGFSLAHCFLAKLYLIGHIVPKDYMNSMLYANFAANCDLSEGWSLLGLFYLFGLAPQVPIDYDKARRCFEKSIELKNYREYSPYCLAVIYFFGLGVDVDIEMANYFFQMDTGNLPEEPFSNIIYYPEIDSYFIDDSDGEYLTKTEVLSELDEILQIVLPNATILERW